MIALSRPRSHLFQQGRVGAISSSDEADNGRTGRVVAAFSRGYGQWPNNRRDRRQTMAGRFDTAHGDHKRPSRCDVGALRRRSALSVDSGASELHGAGDAGLLSRAGPGNMMSGRNRRLFTCRASSLLA